MLTPKFTESPLRLASVAADAFAGHATCTPRFEPVAERPRSGRSQRSAVTASLVLSRREDRSTGRKER
jgi:hypothetical protein